MFIFFAILASYISITSEEDSEGYPLLGMSKPSDDPFYAVRDNVATQVERIKMKNEKFKALMKKVDTSSNADFKELRKGINLFSYKIMH